ncbi:MULTISPECIES: rhomboid-like protein [unclassified Streptomyces]|uniref:rhomboid-like protein n=1 Tax=unclassified Streptomyces TaxID=2593676 RepID=UPI000A71FC25|nr:MULTISPECIES: rhomboid-like protein [unclassified Streptomyces]
MSWLGTAARARVDRAPSAVPGAGTGDGPGAAPAVPPGLLPGVPRQRASRPALVEAEPAVLPQSERRRPWRLLPTPAGTPFTFGYALLLVATSLFAEYADPALVSDLLQGSSTDVVHLAQAPLLVLVASALWIAGGMTSAYAIGFLFVLTALERRIGGLRTAAVFFGGHALATLATELPVAFSVAAGRLPESSLHRLDYGISFGVMTSIGALAGLLPAWLRWPVLVGVGYVAVTDLLAAIDPMTDWGHLLSLTLGIASWPLLRRWRTRHARPVPLLGDLGHPALRGVRTY